MKNFITICFIVLILFSLVFTPKITEAGGGGSVVSVVVNSVVSTVRAAIEIPAGAVVTVGGAIIKKAGDIVGSNTIKDIGSNLEDSGQTIVKDGQCHIKNIGSGERQSVGLSAGQTCGPDTTTLDVGPLGPSPSCTPSTGDWSSCSNACGLCNQTRTNIKADCSSQSEFQTITINCPLGQTCSSNICYSPPTITKFYSSPDYIYVPASESALYWATEGGPVNSCSISGDSGNYTGLSGSGSQSISGLSRGTSNPGSGKTYNYTLTCFGPGGSDTKTTNLTVYKYPVCKFSANPKTITPPESSTLSWDCQYINPGTNGSTAWIVSDKNSEIIKNINVDSSGSTSGSTIVRPTETTIYTLNAIGLDGSKNFPTDGVSSRFGTISPGQTPPGSSSPGSSSSNAVQIKTPGKIIYQEVAPW